MDTSLATVPYRDAALPVAERVVDLLSRMTLDEKVAQLAGVWPRDISSTDDAFDEAKSQSSLRDGIGQISRIAASGVMAPDACARLANDAQRFLIEHTRLGIPAVVHEESCAGFTAKDATQFPQAIGLASTWSPALVEEMAGVIRTQMRAAGARHTLAPVLDIVRDARWGRVEETYGEDPHLTARLGVAYVRGFQTDDLRNGVVCTGKHFLGFGASEGGMNWAPAHLGQREIREVYAAPFEAAIREAGLASIMNSYAEIDGVPCGASPELLTDLLRGEFGFEGTVAADYFTVATLRTYHGIAETKAEAAAAALKAGIDIELPAFNCYRALPDALAAGLIDMATVDRAVKRVLRQKFMLGLFEQPYVDADAALDAFDTPEHRALARTIAAQSMVLLKNDGNLLPLLRSLRSIAVIGPCADSVRLLQGDYHYPAHLEASFGVIHDAGDEPSAESLPALAALAPTQGARRTDLSQHFVPHVTPLDGIRGVLPEAEIHYARGCAITGDDASGIAEAVAAARAAEVAVVFVGTRSGLADPATSGESSDRTDLSLSGVQQRLVDAVVATGTPAVVVLINGGVLAIPEIAGRVPAIIEAWLPGEEAGNALADVLFGDVNPAGRLPVSMPRNAGQMPLYYNHKPSGGRTNWRTHYVDSPATPLFPFGHGLSYTEFQYWEPQLSVAGTNRTASHEGKTRVPASGRIEVAIDITNVGKRAGDEVVQLYLHDLAASVTRPVKQLAAFARVPFAPGETKTIVFEIDMSALAFYDRDMRFVIEPGEVEVMIGASSEDIRQRASFIIDSPRRVLERAEIRTATVRIM